jgi:hypothetical protein
MSIDDFIIDRVYQKITNRVADGFERSCYWLARQAAFAGGGIGIAWTFADNHSAVGIVFFVSCQLLFVVGVYYRSWRAEKRWRAGNAALNTDRIEDRGYRLFYLVLVVLWFAFTLACIVTGIEHASMDALFLLSMFGVYSAWCFLACFPRAPRRKPAKVPIDAIAQGAR